MLVLSPETQTIHKIAPKTSTLFGLKTYKPVSVFSEYVEKYLPKYEKINTMARLIQSMVI